MKQRNSKKMIKQIVKEALPWLAALVIIIPLLIVVFNALKTSQEAINMGFSLPKKINWSNFKEVWDVGNIPRSYINSLILSVSSVCISVVASSLCAFVIARNKTKLNNYIYKFFALGLMFPVSMVTVVKVMRWFGLYNNRMGVILVFSALILPMSVFLYYGFITSIPEELDEAAIMDGAGVFTLFFRILFPVLKPVTMTVIMINFLNTWNDFTVPLYLLPDPDKAVIVQQVYNFYGTFTASWNLVSVTILYAVAPILIIYIIGQKYIISGMTSGAVKG